MNILTRPDDISLAGNINRLVLFTPDDVAFSLSVLGTEWEEVVQHTYSPDASQRIEIDLRDIILPLLTFTLQDISTPYRQEGIARDFSVKLIPIQEDGETKPEQSFLFKVIRAGVAAFASDAESFLKENFLTWQPNTKPVTYYTPEFLTYYAVEDVRIRCDVRLPDCSQSFTLATIPAGQAWTIPVQYAIIAGKTAEILSGDKHAEGDILPLFYDVYAEDTDGNRLTYIQRYYASDIRSEQEEWILFENSLGGIDTFRAYGERESTAEHTHNLAEIDNEAVEYRVDTTRKYHKNTGILNYLERTWLLDFFPSLAKYVYTSQAIRRIVVTESNASFSDRVLPSSFSFTYKYADTLPYLNVARTDQPLDTVNITTPDLRSFTIAPRLVEFPRLTLSGGALFPVQSPYSEQWGTTTAKAFVEYLIHTLEADYSSVGGIGHTHPNLSMLNSLYEANGYLLSEGNKIKAGYADTAHDIDSSSPLYARFLRKDIGDVAAGMVTFLSGVTARVKSYFSGIDNDGDITTTGQLSAEGDARMGGLLQVAKDIISKGLRSWNYSEGGLAGSGFSLTDNDGTGHSRLVVDNLLVRLKATFMDLEVKKLSAVAGDFVFSQAGGVIDEVQYLDGDGQAVASDTVNMPWLVRMLPMAVQRRFMLGRRQMTQRKWQAMTIEERDSVVTFRCFLRSDDGVTRTTNTWRVGDLARCQTLDVSSTTRDDGTVLSGQTNASAPDSLSQLQTQGNVFYWRRVNRADITTTGTRQRAFIDLDNGAVNNGYYPGSDVPCAGDTVVCFGNDNAKLNRSGIVVIETTGEDAPAIKEYRDVGMGEGSDKWSLDGRRKTKISPTTGNEFFAPSFYVETEAGAALELTDKINLEVSNALAANLVSGEHSDWFRDGGTPAPAYLTDGSSGKDIGIGTAGFACSPAFEVRSGETYCISFYMPTENLVTEVYFSASKEWNGYNICSNGALVASVSSGSMDETGEKDEDTASCGRRFFLFKASSDGWCAIKVKGLIASGIINPQVEKGAVPSGYNTTIYESSIRQTASEIDLAIRNDLGAVGIHIDGERKKISLSAETTEVSNDFYAKSLRTSDSGGGVISLHDGVMEMVNPNSNRTNIQIGFNGEYMVLRFFDNDGNLMYDLGPKGLNYLASQDESVTAARSYMMMFSRSADGWTKAQNGADEALYQWATGNYADFIFRTSAADREAISNTHLSYPYKYDAKINAGVYQSGSHAGSSELAQAFDHKYFYDDGIATDNLFTGLLVSRSDVGGSTTDPSQWAGGVNAPVPSDYDEEIQDSCTVDFSLDDNGRYNRPVRRRTLFFVEQGVFKGFHVIYLNVDND